MRRLTAMLLLLATPASAWTVTHEHDRMSDRTLTWASATSGDATLLVGCLNGRVGPRMAWQSRKGAGSGIGVTWRVDNGPASMTTGGLFSQDGTTLYAWPGTFESEVVSGLRTAKRLRVQIGKAFYDFNLVAGERWPQFSRCAYN